MADVVGGSTVANSRGWLRAGKELGTDGPTCKMDLSVCQSHERNQFAGSGGAVPGPRGSRLRGERAVDLGDLGDAGYQESAIRIHLALKSGDRFREKVQQASKDLESQSGHHQANAWRHGETPACRMTP